MIRRTLATLVRAPIVLLACAFALGGAATLAARNAARLLATWGGAGHVVAYLRADASAADAARVAELLRAAPAVVSVERVSPAEAGRRLADALGAESPLLDGVEAGFFPASVEARLRPGAWEAARVSAFAGRLRALPAVERVDFAGEWVERLGRGRRVLVAGASAVAAAALVFGLAIVFGAMRLHVLARRREIEVLRLCGATDRFVRAPFVLGGAAAGALGAGIAALALALAFREASPAVADALGFALAGRPGFFAPREIAVGVAAAAALSAAATAIAVERHVA